VPDPANASTSPWSNRTFATLFSAHVVSLVGSAIGSIALGLLARELVGADVTEVVGISLTIRIIILVFCAPLSGRVADIFGRKATLIAADLLRVAVVIGFFFVTAVWQIYVLAVFLNLGAALFTPIYKSIIPGITGEKAYPKALAAGTVAYDLSQIFGPALAALLIANFGFRGNFLIDAATFLLSAIMIFPLSLSRAKLGDTRGEKKPKPDLLFGIRRMISQPSLRHSLILALRVSIVGALTLVATIGYVTVELGLDDSMYAWAMVALGVGSMLGVTAYAYLPERLQKVLERGTFPALAASLIIAATLPGILWLAVAWIISGAGQGIYNNLSNRLLAANSDEEERSHLYSAHFSLSHVGWGLTYPATGFLASNFGFQTTCWIFLGLLILTLLFSAPSANLDEGSRE
jgi:NRE family putative nickel resistance protein-like MFS transporter